jgi:branched-chain amino acid transport system ATP-binding protein
MSELLAISELDAGYGPAIVLHGISFVLGEGQSLALLGRNGVGKTTLVNTIIGTTRQHRGSIRFVGKDISSQRPDIRAQAGIGWVPQERNIFRSLTVTENMEAVARPGRWTVERAFQLFPRLAERRNNLGYQLSGGEQQMLAIARALVLNPKLLLLDEPTEGLAPIIIDELLAALTRLRREEGLALIMIEQHARKILPLTDKAIILERGRVVHASESAQLLSDQSVLERYLGLETANH